MPFIEKYQENLKAALQTSHVKEIITMEITWSYELYTLISKNDEGARI